MRSNPQRTGESRFPVPKTRAAFHSHAQRNAFRRRDVRLQSRLFVHWNQSLKRSRNSTRFLEIVSNDLPVNDCTIPHPPHFAAFRIFQSVWMREILAGVTTIRQRCARSINPRESGANKCPFPQELNDYRRPDSAAVVSARACSPTLTMATASSQLKHVLQCRAVDSYDRVGAGANDPDLDPINVVAWISG
jgi:hypothetical protein